KISWEGPTEPPGESTRSRTARMFGASRKWRRSSTTCSLSSIGPLTSTTPTLPKPPKAISPALRSMATKPSAAKESRARTRPPKMTTRTTAVRFSTAFPLPGSRPHHHPIAHVDLAARGDHRGRGGVLEDVEDEELGDDLPREVGDGLVLRGVEAVAGLHDLEDVAHLDAVLLAAVEDDDLVLAELAHAPVHGGGDASDHVARVR